MGGTSFHSFDSGLVHSDGRNYGFRDFAILYRLNVVGDAIEENLKSSGLPIQRIRKSNPKDEADGLDWDADAISLMTIHASKGLEFPVVFIVGCEEGTIPYLKGGNPEVVDLEEELRILYVAATRAQDHLYIMHSESRSLFHNVSHLQQSRFLRNLDQLSCVDSPIMGKRRRAAQISMF
jgi:DNA helicase-2/ATP-dependent DNA helicase PcrA